MATFRITLYGWIIAHDPVQGWGSGSLVDLVYFVDSGEGYIQPTDIFRIVESAGYKMISKKVSGTKMPEADRITVERWDEHLKVGVERVPAPAFKEQPSPYAPPSQYYGRYG